MVQVRGLVALAKRLDPIVPERAIDLNEGLGILRRQVSQPVGRGRRCLSSLEREGWKQCGLGWLAAVPWLKAVARGCLLESGLAVVGEMREAPPRKGSNS